MSAVPPTFGPRYFVEDVYPAVDGGRFPVKRIAGEPVEVWADIFRDGHAVTAASLRWRREGETVSQASPMVLHAATWNGADPGCTSTRRRTRCFCSGARHE